MEHRRKLRHQRGDVHGIVIHRFEGERKNISLLLVNVRRVSGLTGGTAEETPAGIKIAVTGENVSYTEEA